jgi:hypothetical protein
MNFLTDSRGLESSFRDPRSKIRTHACVLIYAVEYILIFIYIFYGGELRPPQRFFKIRKWDTVANAYRMRSYCNISIRPLFHAIILDRAAFRNTLSLRLNTFLNTIIWHHLKKRASDQLEAQIVVP